MKKHRKNGQITNAYLNFMRAKYKAFLNSTKYTLNDCYIHPSQGKLLSFAKLKEKYGIHFIGNSRIISYNIHQFVVAINAENGFYVETYKNTYFISWEELFGENNS